jgi:hypothetical protein
VSHGEAPVEMFFSGFENLRLLEAELSILFTPQIPGGKKPC